MGNLAENAVQDGRFKRQGGTEQARISNCVVGLTDTGVTLCNRERGHKFPEAETGQLR